MLAERSHAIVDRSRRVGRRRKAPAIGTFVLIACLAPGLAAAEGLLAGGYRVSVHVALPNVETRDYDFSRTICWRGADDRDMPLGPLGPGPFADCPSHASDRPEGVVVSTACEGPNAGRAVATYRRTPGGFTGQVDINLGGKNMTLSEVQRGTRLGECQ